MNKYSIIIPHKNRLELLERCLSSIPQRKDVQIIVVDDNSDPTQVDFSSLEQICRSRNAELILTMKGKGAGYARNVGLSRAQGRYLLFSDCDDVFSEELDSILDHYINSNEDIVFFNVDCVDEDGNILDKSPEFDYYRDNIEKALKFSNYDILRFGMNPPWGKIISRQLVVDNHIKFDETPVANDIIFSVKTGLAAKKVGVSNSTIYKWTVSSNSITTRKTLSSCDCHFNAAITKNNLLLKAGQGKYRANLIKQLKRFRGKGWIVISNRLVKAIINTSPRYLLSDIVEAVNTLLKNKYAES